jgi:hypothetical protein
MAYLSLPLEDVVVASFINSQKLGSMTDYVPVIPSEGLKDYLKANISLELPHDVATTAVPFDFTKFVALVDEIRKNSLLPVEDDLMDRDGGQDKRRHDQILETGDLTAHQEISISEGHPTEISPTVSGTKKAKGTKK